MQLAKSIEDLMRELILETVKKELGKTIKEAIQTEVRMQFFLKDGRIKNAIVNKAIAVCRRYLLSELRKDLIWEELSEETRDEIVKKLLSE